MGRMQVIAVRTGRNEMLKAERRKLSTWLTVWADAHGSRPDPERREWQVPTVAGMMRLSIHVRSGHDRSDYDGSIFCQFRDADTACRFVGCSVPSGKCNFHFGRVTAEDAWNQFHATIGHLALDVESEQHACPEIFLVRS